MLLLLAFGLGGVTGALAYRMVEGRAAWRVPERAERFPAAMLARLRHHLGLRPEQAQQVEAALQEAGEEFRKIREEFRPRFRDVRARTEGRIRDLLDPDQQAGYSALVAEWERRIERWHDRRPPPRTLEEPAPRGPRP